MPAISIIPFSDRLHRPQVVALWQSVFGYETAHNEPNLVINKKLEVDDNMLLVALLNDSASVVGTVMAGYDGHRGWIYSLAVSPTHRKQGIGSKLVKAAEAALASKGCLKINLQILPHNETVTQFYSGLGYLVEERISMGKRLIAEVNK